MVDFAHDLPRLTVILDVAPPGERFEADAQAASCRPIAELTEVIDDAIPLAERFRRDIGADEYEVGAELFHDVELAFGSVEHARAQARGHALEVAERLERSAGEPLVAQHRANYRHWLGTGKQVALEDLHVLETSVGDRAELRPQRAVDADRSDGSQHGLLRNQSPTLARGYARQRRALVGRLHANPHTHVIGTAEHVEHGRVRPRLRARHGHRTFIRQIRHAEAQLPAGVEVVRSEKVEQVVGRDAEARRGRRRDRRDVLHCILVAPTHRS